MIHVVLDSSHPDDTLLIVRGYINKTLELKRIDDIALNLSWSQHNTVNTNKEMNSLELRGIIFVLRGGRTQSKRTLMSEKLVICRQEPMSLACSHLIDWIQGFPQFVKLLSPAS